MSRPTGTDPSEARGPAAVTRTSSVLTVILNWECAPATLRCAQAVREGSAHTDVCLVDNASADGSLDDLLTAFPWEAVVARATNGGYAAGMNEGLRLARERGYTFAWLLNADAVPDPDALEQLLAHVGPAGVAASRQVTGHAADERSYVVGASWVGGKLRTLACAGCHRASHEVDVVTGASLLVRVDTLERVGLMEESYFHYKEEFEFTHRASAHGPKNRVVCASRVWHAVGGSLPAASPTAEYYRTRNELLFVRRNFPGTLRRLALKEHRFLAGRVALVLRARTPAQRAVARAVVHGAWDFLRGRGGSYASLHEAMR